MPKRLFAKSRPFLLVRREASMLFYFIHFGVFGVANADHSWQVNISNQFLYLPPPPERSFGALTEAKNIRSHLNLDFLPNPPTKTKNKNKTESPKQANQAVAFCGNAVKLGLSANLLQELFVCLPHGILLTLAVSQIGHKLAGVGVAV